MWKNFLRIENGAANQAIISITAFISFIFGGYTPLLKSYLVLMMFDFFTAIIYHIGNRSLNSWQAFTGLLRKIVCLFIIFAAYHAEQFIGVELPIKDIVLAYLAILDRQVFQPLEISSEPIFQKLFLYHNQQNDVLH